MAQVSFNIPTLVQNIEVDNKSSYYLRPLFMHYPVATHRRFEMAMSQFQKEVKQTFKGFVVSRHNLDGLLWFQFHPELKYQNPIFSFNLGKQYVNGNISMVSFDLQGYTFICLPSINNYMFMVEKSKAKRTNLVQKTSTVIRELFRKLKKENPKEFTPSIYFSKEKEFITSVSVNVNIGYGPFKFEESNDNWFFSRLSGNQDFIGAVEIEKVGYDLNSSYPSQLRRAYYQDDLVDQLYKIIYQTENTPIALIGKEGVGKHTVIEEVIWRYESKYYGNRKGGKQRMWHIDPTRIISGMSIVGMWQKRFEAILKYIKKPVETAKHSDKMVVDNIVAMLRIGKSSQNDMTLSDVLKPYLEKRQLQMVIVATSEEWKVMQEQDRRFSDLFQVIRLQEPEPETAVKIVLQQRKALELENVCEITIQAIDQLFTIQRNYLKHKALPGAVMKLLTQLAVKYKFQEVDVPEVREEFETFSGLKERIFDTTHTFEEDEVQKAIAAQLVGQPDAVQTLANLVHTVKAKLTDKSKPLGSFMFIGPTGVGKTQAAKVLCQYLMGNEDSLMRFDMNEYIDGSSVQRLIGDYNNPEGQLTGKVRYRPFGIVLLDEIEKAHPKVHDLLLQVLDDGRLTDSLGRTVDFSNTIIIMTSNVGAREVNWQIGIGSQGKDDAAVYRKALENRFRPEFINRIDKVVIFNALELEHILNIARLQIKELLKRDGFVRRTTILNISQDALEWVAKRGFDAKMGGRALKRQIERDLTTLSAEQLISSYSDNPIIFDILYENDRLTPRINTLEFVEPLENEWIPSLPDETKGKSFYRKLLLSVERLEERIKRYEYDANVNQSDVIVINGQGDDFNWQYFDFKDKVAENKEQIKTIMLGFKDRYFKNPPAIPLRLKTGYLYLRRQETTKAVRQNIKDRLFQQEALKEITEGYQYGAAEWDSMKTEFIDTYLNVAFLQLFARGVFKEETQKVTLHFTSCITGMGKKEVQFLAKQFAAILEELDIAHELAEDKSHIVAEGHSLTDLLQGEVGIHMFYRSHENPLPVKVSIEQAGVAIVDSPAKVIRIYDRSNTLTDLRTGFTNEANITVEEFKLLLYAGIREELRRDLF